MNLDLLSSNSWHLLWAFICRSWHCFLCWKGHFTGESRRLNSNRQSVKPIPGPCNLARCNVCLQPYSLSSYEEIQRWEEQVSDWQEYLGILLETPHPLNRVLSHVWPWLSGYAINLLRCDHLAAAPTRDLRPNTLSRNVYVVQESTVFFIVTLATPF